MPLFKTVKAIRTVIKAVRDGKIMLVDCEGGGQTFINKELFQQYGVASKPLPDSEGILLLLGQDNGIVIATEDRRYRLTLQGGEVGLYTDEGDFIHLKRNKEIHINTGNKVTIDAATEININTTDATITCSGDATINAQKADIIADTVNLGDNTGDNLMKSTFAPAFDAHVHTGNLGNLTSPPTAPVGINYNTTKTKAA